MFWFSRQTSYVNGTGFGGCRPPRIENWPFGKEAPVLDLSQVISQAGLHSIGQSYMGENWTEVPINNISGMDGPLRQIVLSIHRSMLLTAAQKSYLVAALGSVTPVQPTPTGWDKTGLSERPGTGEMLEALALALSSSLGEKKLHRQYKAEKDGEISQLQSVVDSLQVERERLSSL